MKAVQFSKIPWDLNTSVSLLIGHHRFLVYQVYLFINKHKSLIGKYPVQPIFQGLINGLIF